MKKIIISALALLTVSLVALPSQAQTWRSETRESRQDHRIQRNAYQGNLTPREYRQLKRQQYRVDRAQNVPLAMDTSLRVSADRSSACRTAHRATSIARAITVVDTTDPT